MNASTTFWLLALSTAAMLLLWLLLMVRMWQQNIEKRIVAHVPVAGGQVLEEGAFELDGVAFPGAEIRIDFLEPAGGSGLPLLPTGRTVDRLEDHPALFNYPGENGRVRYGEGIAGLVAEAWRGRHAVVALPDPKKGERIILVTDRRDAEVAPLVAHAQAIGAPEIAVPRKIIRVPEIPVLGTGKTDYVALQRIVDAEMRREMDRCRREGTPRPESSAVRAHVPAAFWSFANSWRDLFRNGVCEHAIKELCRLYVSRSVQCDYCGNQRSIKAAAAGMMEEDVKDLLNFEKSTRYSDRQKAALGYAEAITWRLDTDDALWERLHRHFTEPQLVELGCFIALTMGQQSWLRLLNIDHHQVLAGTSASMAPGFESAEALARSKAASDYWAKSRAGHGGAGS